LLEIHLDATPGGVALGQRRLRLYVTALGPDAVALHLQGPLSGGDLHLLQQPPLLPIVRAATGKPAPGKGEDQTRDHQRPEHQRSSGGSGSI
jgi:hypothetical protein